MDHDDELGTTETTISEAEVAPHTEGAAALSMGSYDGRSPSSEPQEGRSSSVSPWALR